MNQRTFLGLSHNPFTPPREGFFPGGDRKTHLDHLRHLSQWSRRVLVVSGPFGIGKSSLFRELSGSLEPNTKAARISGTVVTSEREILVGLLQGFGIAADLDSHAEDLAGLITDHANEQETHGRVCMVMADDAHLLEVQAVQRLVALVATSSLRMLFFAEASLINNLDRVARKHDIEWFEIRLTGFPKGDVRDYLEWRFRQAHYRGLLPFTDEQVQKIVARSSGNPSVIDSMANRLLADMESGEIRNQSVGFPTTHVTLGFLLLVMVGLVYMYALDEPKEIDSGAGEPQIVQADLLSDDLADEADEADEQADEQGNNLMLDQVGEPTNEQIGEQTNEQIAEQTIAQTKEQTLPQTKEQSSEQPADPGINPEQVEVLPVQAASSELSAVVDDPVALEQPSEATVVDGADTDFVADLPALVEEPAKETSTIAAQALEDAQPTSEPDRDDTSPINDATELFNSAQWLMAQDPDRYTMQLLTLSSRERAVQFIGRQASAEEFGLYRLQRDGKFLHVVTYGVFSSRGAAQSAGQAFTGELAALKPWIRPMSLVQDAIRTTPQE